MEEPEMLTHEEIWEFIRILQKHMAKFDGRKITEIPEKEALDAYDEAWEEFEKERHNDTGTD